MIHTTTPLDVDALADALKRAGWSMGEVATGLVWVVSGSHRWHEVVATGVTQVAAWRLAYVKAADLFNPFGAIHE